MVDEFHAASASHCAFQIPHGLVQHKKTRRILYLSRKTSIRPGQGDRLKSHRIGSMLATVGGSGVTIKGRKTDCRSSPQNLWTSFLSHSPRRSDSCRPLP